MKLFISYSRDDSILAYPLTQELRKNPRNEVWIDLQIPGSEDWWKTILEAIEWCDCCLFIMSERSVKSIYCEAEIGYVLAWNKPILPLMHKQCDYPRQLSERRIQYLNLTAIFEVREVYLQVAEALLEVQQSIRDGDYPRPAHDPIRPPVPKPQTSDDPDDPSDLYFLAEKRFQQGEIAEAERLFKKLKAVDPEGFGAEAEPRLKELHLQRERVNAYVKIADRVAAGELDPARIAWKVYIRKYGTAYDPNGYATDPRFPNHNPPPVSYVDPPVIIPLPKPAIINPAFTLPLLEWVPILAGDVTIELGDWEKDKDGKYIYVTKSKQVYPVEAFSISKYPVTNAQYLAFVGAPDGYPDAQWWDYSEYARKWRKTNPKPRESQFKGDKRPRENVTWYEAIAFCRWLSHKTGLPITLPTEPQWQHAAQGDTHWAYPWGDTFDKDKCNTNQSGIGETTDVDRYGKNGKGFSPYGVYDLSGNVWEWCLNTYNNIDDVDINRSDTTPTSVRGGSWSVYPEYARAAVRNWIQSRQLGLPHRFSACPVCS